MLTGRTCLGLFTLVWRVKTSEKVKNEWRNILEETEGILKNLTRVKGKGQETPLTKVTF